MPKIPFTVRKIEGLKAPSTGRVDYWADDMPGFGLRISDRGRRTWMVMYRAGGRQRRLKIGTSPPLSLADAREKAGDMLHDVAHGKDPAVTRDADRAADTVEDLAKLYIEKHAKPNKRSWETDQRMLNHDVLPTWGKRKAKSIRRRDVIELLDKIVERGAPIMANRTYEVIRRMFRFAVERDIVDAHPCVGITKPGEERQRERVLSEDEIRAVWMAMGAEPFLLGAVLKLRFLTAQRGAEVRLMRWSDIDPDIASAKDIAWWTIPGEVTKNGRTHRVPLTRAAIDLLKDVRQQHDNRVLVFPGRTGKPGVEKWYSGNRVRKASKVDFVPHDLRRTAASLMTGMGISRLTVGKILNHTDPSVTAVYDRHSYDAEKHAALEAWSRRLVEIISGERHSSNVLEMVRA